MIFLSPARAGVQACWENFLGEGKTYQQAVQLMEGETLEAALMVMQMAKALPKLEERGILTRDQMPFMKMLIDIIMNGKPVEFLLDKFFTDCCI